LLDYFIVGPVMQGDGTTVLLLDRFERRPSSSHSLRAVGKVVATQDSR
jgi:hypothetical protein